MSRTVAYSIVIRTPIQLKGTTVATFDKHQGGDAGVGLVEVKRALHDMLHNKPAGTVGTIYLLKEGRYRDAGYERMCKAIKLTAKQARQLHLRPGQRVIGAKCNQRTDKWQVVHDLVTIHDYTDDGLFNTEETPGEVNSLADN